MLKTLSALYACLVICAAAPAFAQSAVDAPSAPASTAPSSPSSPAKFAQHQQRLLGRLASQISILQQEQTCVQGATEPGALRACQDQAKSALQALRPQHQH